VARGWASVVAAALLLLPAGPCSAGCASPRHPLGGCQDPLESGSKMRSSDMARALWQNLKSLEVWCFGGGWVLLLLFYSTLCYFILFCSLLFIIWNLKIFYLFPGYKFKKQGNTTQKESTVLSGSYEMCCFSHSPYSTFWVVNIPATSYYLL